MGIFCAPNPTPNARPMVCRQGLPGHTLSAPRPERQVAHVALSPFFRRRVIRIWERCFGFCSPWPRRLLSIPASLLGDLYAALPPVLTLFWNNSYQKPLWLLTLRARSRQSFLLPLSSSIRMLGCSRLAASRLPAKT